VQVAASMAQAASTAFPPCVKMVAPAVAASGLPVMAIQFLPCKGGFCVCCPFARLQITIARKIMQLIFFILIFYDFKSKQENKNLIYECQITEIKDHIKL